MVSLEAFEARDDILKATGDFTAEIADDVELSLLEASIPSVIEESNSVGTNRMLEQQGHPIEVRFLASKRSQPQLKLPIIQLTEEKIRVGKAQLGQIRDERLHEDLFEVMVSEETISIKPLVEGTNLESMHGALQPLQKDTYYSLENGDTILLFGNSYSFRLDVDDHSQSQMAIGKNIDVHEDDSSSNIESMSDVEDVSANDDTRRTGEKRLREDEPIVRAKKHRTEESTLLELDEFLNDAASDDVESVPEPATQVSVTGSKVSGSEGLSESIQPPPLPLEADIGEDVDVEISTDDHEQIPIHTEEIMSDVVDGQRQEIDIVGEHDVEPIPPNWQNVSTELMCWIFSYGMLDAVDACRCMRVCKTWHSVCSDNQIWRIVCLNRWSLGRSPSLVDMFTEKQFEWRGVCKLELLSETRRLRVSRIEEGYSIMANLLASRDRGSPSCFLRLQQVMSAMESDVAVEQYVREYEAMVDRECDREDVIFLINNVYTTIRPAEDSIHCQVITKDAKIVRLSLHFLGDQRTFQIYIDQGLLFDNTVAPLLNMDSLTTLRNNLGVSLSKCHLFFFLWKYCLMHDISPYMDSVGKYLQEEFGWSWDPNLFSDIPKESDEMPSTTEHNQIEESEDVDIL